MKAPEGQGPFQHTCLARLGRIGSLGLSNTCAPIDVLKEHIVSVAGSLPQVFRVSKARPRSSTIPPKDEEGTDSYKTLLSGQHQSIPQQPPPDLRTPRCHNLFVFERGQMEGRMVRSWRTLHIFAFRSQVLKTQKGAARRSRQPRSQMKEPVRSCSCVNLP